MRPHCRHSESCRRESKRRETRTRERDTHNKCGGGGREEKRRGFGDKKGEGEGAAVVETSLWEGRPPSQAVRHHSSLSSLF
jgi:hypothetical protein